MKWNIVSPLLLALALAFGGQALAADATGAKGVDAGESTDGSVVLGNTSPGDNQGAPAAASDSTAAAADGEKDPRELYRDKLLQNEAGATGASSAVTRRYKMMDRDTYRANVVGASAETPPPAKTR